MKLPVADSKQVLIHLAHMVRDFKGSFALVLGLQLGAALTGVALPWILGTVVDRIQTGTTLTWVSHVMILAVGLVLVACVLSFFAEYQARVLGERIFAGVREHLVHTVTHLPLSTVESAGTGDLVGRSSHDVDRIQFMVRQGVSAVLTLAATIAVTVVAAVVTSPILACTMLVEIPVIVAVMRWYLPRTIPAYRTLSARWAEVSGVVNETVEQASTVDAANLGFLRFSRLDRTLREAWRLERYTAFTRIFLLGGLMIVFLPILLVILVGGWLLPYGWTTIGAITTVALYTYQLRGPIQESTFWVDQMQSSLVSLSRIYGVDQVDSDRTPTGAVPDGLVIQARDVTYAYRPGVDVLHQVNLDLKPGETLAMVGPSGAGKSTFGRMIAGIHPPTGGTVTVGGVPLTDLPEAELHRQVVLVTQEHHVFVGTIADNLRLAATEASVSELWEALSAVEAEDWVRALDDGLDTKVGAGGLTLTPAQAQQIALARIVLMDPHTLVLDEATSLLDPTAARSLERSLGKVLAGRTVVAIAHRLYTAHDADRVAVMLDGRIVELGTHDELVAQGGEYARLWESWQKE